MNTNKEDKAEHDSHRERDILTGLNTKEEKHVASNLSKPFLFNKEIEEITSPSININESLSPYPQERGQGADELEGILQPTAVIKRDRYVKGKDNSLIVFGNVFKLHFGNFLSFIYFFFL